MTRGALAAAEELHLAIVVPDFDLPTSKARAAFLRYSREDAVFNVQRAAL